MCGIIGAVGHPDAAPVLLEGLRRLEYRGYDSAGIAVTDGERFAVCRAVGKLDGLAAEMAGSPMRGHTGIGHTRWATHGLANLDNAHPLVAGDRVAVVHNGIIENYRDLRGRLEEGGCVFTSDTDSEVLAHLYAAALEGGADLLTATARVVEQITGAYAFVVMVRDHADVLAFAKNVSPLAVGPAEGASYVGSDAMAMGMVTQKAIFLRDGDYGVIEPQGMTLCDRSGASVNREMRILPASAGLVSKEGYHHFMEKEIHEQPDAVIHTLAGITDAGGELSVDVGVPLESLSGMALLAAGTSYHAALTGRYWLESLADLPAVAETASEFRYRSPSLRHVGLALGLSQSGESLDTLMALRHASENGIPTAGLVNVSSSTIARESDSVLVTHAGPEIGVASTKTYLSQLVVLLALSAVAARRRGVMDGARFESISETLHRLPRLLGESLSVSSSLRGMVSVLAGSSSCLYLGRGLLYPLALEGALKLKELSYIHAEGYAAGEMKHGPIALLEPGVPVVVTVSDDVHLAKTVNNILESRARGAEVLLIGTESAADKVLSSAPGSISSVATVPDVDSLAAPLLLALPLQLLAYETAVLKGTDVDQPRNLAKSVTVE